MFSSIHTQLEGRKDRTLSSIQNKTHENHKERGTNMKHLTIQQGATLTGKSVQALYQAARRGKLHTVLIGGEYHTTVEALLEYQVDKRFCDNLIVNGKRLFCEEQGFCSVKQASLMLKTSINRIYRCLVQGIIKSDRVGRYYTIPISEIHRLSECEDFAQYA